MGPLPAPLTVRRVACEYRQRFGIESSYRLLHQVRARTTSRSPAWRLLLVSLACLLVNLWVWLKATLVLCAAQSARRAARQWVDATLRLDAWRDLLREAILTDYGVRDRLAFPFPLASVTRFAEY